MQFVKNGPEVPARLLQAHEDGQVVFFCGAGVSCSAGLPGFEGLAKRIYEELHVTPSAAQETAFKAKQFDQAIGLLEDQLVGGRDIVRRSLVKILTAPNRDMRNATVAHEALLTLGRISDGRMRLVTTNFDRLFEKVVADKGLVVPRYEAPLLPVPKKRWDGLVYLHGLLPAGNTDGNLDELVVSSGDFGRAYLTERWAARFVGELFRNFTVCFVGYSIDDPVMRYMTDSLAADRLLGESPREMFAFGSSSKGRENESSTKWKGKNVTLIQYRDDNDHEYLYATLHEWGNSYRDGVSGKESIVARYAGLHPTASTEEDNFVGRMLWALSDSSGWPAKRFAERDPVPTLEWLEPLSEHFFGHADLDRFGVHPNSKPDESLEFSLIRRPSPYTRAPWMTLMDEGPSYNAWDTVMQHMACWLLRYLDEPRLVLWLAQRGARLHPEFAERIEKCLSDPDELERDDESEELNRITTNAPYAVPGAWMRKLWCLLLARRVTSARQEPNVSRSSSVLRVFPWRNRLKRDGLTTALRLEIRDMLTPLVSISEPIPWSWDPDDGDESEALKDPVDWKIVLSIDHVDAALKPLRESPRWKEILPDLLADFGALLREAMDLSRDLGGADDRTDRSYIYRPSIGDHQQNIHLPDRAVLIELTRDAWLATLETSPDRARRAAEDWRAAPYPVFRRMAFFAATQGNVISPRQGLEWLLADDHWWLWTVETQREAMRLLVVLAPALDAESRGRLERAILAGPPRSMYKIDIEPEDWSRLVASQVWLRLAKMNYAGAALGADARSKLMELSTQHREWQVEPDESHEFPVWTGGGGRGEVGDFVVAPRRPRELVDWLIQNPGEDIWQDGEWSRRCRDDFRLAAWALCTLAEGNTWPTIRWRQALYVWSEEDQIKRSWRYMAPVLAKAPGHELKPLLYEVGRWLAGIAKTLDRNEALFFRLSQAALELDSSDGAVEEDDDPVTQAINHPVGQVTKALLNWWTRSPLKDGQGLPEVLKPILVGLCDVHVDHLRHGRVLLASRAVTLFRVDSEWTTSHLLPLFDWSRSITEACSTWSGFLWSPRLYRPLMESIKNSLLMTARHYDTLNRYGTQYAALLTSAGLEGGNVFTRSELRAATQALPEGGLRNCAEVMVDALEAAGSRRIEYWRNRVRPYLQAVWPKWNNQNTPRISECLGRLCIAAGDEFPDALNELRHWLRPPTYPGRLMGDLKDSSLCSQYPDHALRFLACVTGEEAPLGDELADCLRQIRSVAPHLEIDERFKRLRDVLLRSGQEFE